MTVGYALATPTKQAVISQSRRKSILSTLCKIEASDVLWEAITTMKLGYARVSTQDQHLLAQSSQLKEAGCEKVYGEKLSGAKRERPELAKLLEQIRRGDTLIVTKLDRLARHTAELLAITQQLQEAGASFRSLAEPWADTTNHAGKFIMTVFAGIAEFERERIKERCAEGIKSARKNGVRFGRPPVLTPEQVRMVQALRREGRSTGYIARQFHISTQTVRRLLQHKSRNNGDTA